jgi:hypothetical protein
LPGYDCGTPNALKLRDNENHVVAGKIIVLWVLPLLLKAQANPWCMRPIALGIEPAHHFRKSARSLLQMGHGIG